MSEWISVESRLPEFGEMVLTFDNGGGYGIDSVGTAYKFSADYPCEPPFPVTHWMPLPKPPIK
jgi:hypothetical protein